MLFVDASMERPSADLNRVFELPCAVSHHLKGAGTFTSPATREPVFVKNTSLEHDLLVMPLDGQRGDPDPSWPLRLVPLQAQSFGTDGAKWWIV